MGWYSSPWAWDEPTRKRRTQCMDCKFHSGRWCSGGKRQVELSGTSNRNCKDFVEVKNESVRI